jgi:hypothetical protein
MSIKRLRDATRAVGETINDVPPLDLGTRTKRAWLVPLAAAASVAVAVAAGTVIAKGGGNGISQVAASTAGPVAAPKFMADLDQDGITVRSVNGGATTATVPQPSARERFTFIQATQDNRLFYAATETDDCHPRFYQFTLDENGQANGFGVLPFGPAEGTQPTSFAVSGDGTKLVYGAIPCVYGKAPSSLVVTDTATGDSHAWTTQEEVAIADVSVSADGSKVAFRQGPAFPPKLVDASPLPMPSEIPSPAVSPPATPGDKAPMVAPTPVFSKEAGSVVTSTEPSPKVAAGEAASVVALQKCSFASDMIAFQGQPSGPVASGRPKDAPSDLPSALPSDVPPSALPSGVPSGAVDPREAPSPLATAAGALPGMIWSACEGLTEVWLLDTNAAGGSLDQAHKLTLSASYDGVTGGIMGVQLSPDGTQLIASLGGFGARIVDGKLQPLKGSTALIAYGTADGQPIGTLYKDTDKGSMMLLDLDGSGQNALVQRTNEIGMVDASGYHTIRAAADNDATKKMIALSLTATW